MPVRKRAGSPYYWYSFSIGGHRFRGSTRESEKSRAKEVERDQYQLAKRSLRVQSDWSLQAVLSAYWTEHGRDKASAGSIETHFADLQRLLGKGLRTTKLTNGALMDYRAKRRGEGLKHHSINREFAYLHAAYTHCAKMHDQPMPNIKWARLKAKEPDWRQRFLGREEYAALMAAIHADARPIILCAVTTGLRRQNILRLDWRQVKLPERLIQVTVKGGKSHSVRIAPALMAALSTTPPEKRRGRVFDVTNFRKRWDAALKEAEIEDFRFHDLRHTFASWARQAGADLADIREALGHASIGMTMRYAHIKPEAHRTAFDRVSEALLAQSKAQAPAKRRATKSKSGD